MAPKREASASEVRVLADQAFSRTAGAPLVEGNAVRLLCDATENYPAWLEAIAAAKRYIHFETYIMHDDSVGERFADALLARASAGVAVRLVYDWVGALGNTSRLEEGGGRTRSTRSPGVATGIDRHLVVSFPEKLRAKLKDAVQGA